MKKDDKNVVYVICPRCDLNYINKKEKLCTVCKAEIGLLDASILIPDDEEVGVEKLCPVCRINYIADDEEICFLCAKERDDRLSSKMEGWEYDDEEIVGEVIEEEVIDDIDIAISDDEEPFEDEEEEFSEYKEPNDFNYDVDESDFEDDDEEFDDEDIDADDDF